MPVPGLWLPGPKNWRKLVRPVGVSAREARGDVDRFCEATGSRGCRVTQVVGT